MSMLRSLGSSLVAKNSPGSATRDTIENRISNPSIPGKGEPESAVRKFVEEPKLNDVSPGSEKNIRVSPGEQVSLPGDPLASPQPELLPGIMGLPGPGAQPAAQPGQPQAQLRSGADAQPLFQGGVTPNTPKPVTASSATRGGKTATSVSGGPLLDAFAAPTPKGDIGTYGASTESKQVAEAPGPARTNITGTENPLTKLLGGRVSADEGGVRDATIGQTFGQVVAGPVGKAISTAGKAVNKALGTNVNLGGLGSSLQSFGGDKTPAQTGQGSIQAALRSLTDNIGANVNNLRSQASSIASNVKNNVSSKLRSLFGR